MIPQKLYRGDSDSQNERMLRYTFSRQQFCTNLIRGGVGERIFIEPLIDLLNTHILSKFEKSHFLSFTESRTSPMCYGLNLITDDEVAIEECSIQSYSEDDHWDLLY